MDVSVGGMTVNNQIVQAPVHQRAGSGKTSRSKGEPPRYATPTRTTAIRSGCSMSHSGVEMNLRISAGLDYVAAGDDADVRAHYVWSLKQVMHNVAPEDLTTPELVALLAVLIPAHSRVLVGKPSSGDTATVLQLVPNNAASGS